MTSYLNGARHTDLVYLAPRRAHPGEHLGVSAASSSRDVADDLDERAQTDADPVAAVLACRHELTRLGDALVGVPDAVDGVAGHLDEITGAMPAIHSAADDLPRALTVLIATVSEGFHKLAVAVVAAAVVLGVALVLAAVLT